LHCGEQVLKGLEGGKAAPKSSSSPPCQDPPTSPKAAAVQGPPFLENDMLNMEDKIAAEIIYSCEYLNNLLTER